MYMEKLIRYFFVFIFITTLIFNNYIYSTQIVNAENQALTNAQADKQRLERELQDLEKEIAQKQQELSAQKGQSVSISRDIAILTTQIKKSKLDIQSKALVIKKLGGEIDAKGKKIAALSTKIEREKESLAQLIRKERQIEDKSIIHLVLSQDNISDAYSDISNFASIKRGIQESVDEINGVKKLTEAERKDLEKKKNEETDNKYQLETAKAKVELTEKEKSNLLNISKSKETEYQKVIDEKNKRKAQILSAIFNLVGGSQQINFEQALTYAKEAGKQFNIDPAFLLAILTQESNLGKNVGQCYLTDTTTGNGKGANTGSAQVRVMSPTRDIPVFLSITSKLGLDYTSTRVSCWIPMYRKDKTAYGWGGAMGPAQFIPSTWKMFEGRLKSVLGREASPWNPRDAFFASAMYLTDLGAVGNTPSLQHRAACKYYGTGGATCSYSNSVMKYKIGIQNNIDLLQD